MRFDTWMVHQLYLSIWHRGRRQNPCGTRNTRGLGCQSPMSHGGIDRLCTERVRLNAGHRTANRASATVRQTPKIQNAIWLSRWTHFVRSGLYSTEFLNQKSCRLQLLKLPYKLSTHQGTLAVERTLSGHVSLSILTYNKVRGIVFAFK